MNYKFVNKGTIINPMIYLYCGNEEKFLGGDIEMLTYMLHLPFNSDITFENFNIFQMKHIKENIREFKKFADPVLERTKNATHIMTHKDTQFLFLDNINVREEMYKIALSFREIDSIEYRKIGKNKIITVTGTMERYGIKNEYGFYDIESNEFFSNDMINPEFDTYDSFEDIYPKYKIKENKN